MPVKYWSRAGLMLTDWCDAACACCYANCGPSGQTWMARDDALRVWRGLIEASPHGCRVHLTGGEPFGRFEDLLDLCRAARREGLGPLEAIETNASWATDPVVVRQCLKALDAAGMERLAVSADPYHQQFVPIKRVRMLVQVAESVLGPDRVRVRFRDWLTDGFDVTGLAGDRVAHMFAEYACRGRERMTGRAADRLDQRMVLKAPSDFDDKPCSHRLLRGKHVHVAPTGEIWPATCIGIVVGNAFAESASDLWARLASGFDRTTIVGPLSRRGPMGLLELAKRHGFTPRRQGYGGKCQLCWELRRHLQARGVGAEELGPDDVYAGNAEDLAAERQ